MVLKLKPKSVTDALSDVRRLIQKLEADDSPSGDPLKQPPQVFFAHQGKGGLMLWGDEARDYADCLRNLYESVGRHGQVSLKTVENSLQVAITEALDIEKNNPEKTFRQRLDDAIGQLTSVLQARPAPWHFYYRVEGLALTGLPLEVGKVQFFVADKDNGLPALLVKVNDRIDERPGTIEQMKGIKQYARGVLSDHFEGQVVAQVAIEAVDQEAADALAQHELRLTLDVINFYGDLIHPLSNRVRVCMRGEGYRILDGLLGFRLGQQPTFTVGEVVRGPLDLLNWAAMDADKSKMYGFQRIARVLAQVQRSDLEDRILAAFQWAGRASVDDRREQAFLLYAIALESLLLGSKFEAEVGYRLRLRCAHLLGLSIDGKKRIMKNVSDLYSTRSKIVHSGSFEVTDGDLSLMRFVTKNALISVLTEGHFLSMSGEGEFEQWFEDKILGDQQTAGPSAEPG